MKLGSAFSDAVIEDRGDRRIFHGGVNAWWRGSGRALMFSTVLFFSFFVLIWRLFDLTVIHGHSYRVLAEGNRTKELIRHAPRGILLDRTGKPLVENVPEYRLIKPCDKGQQSAGGACTTRLSREEGDAMIGKGLPSGWFLEVDYRRNYLYPEATAHVVGYTGELSAAELKDPYYHSRNYRFGDRIGRTGIEAVYEDRLRGRDGKELVEVSAEGQILRTLGRDPEIPGETIQLSIDAGLSDIAAKNFPKDLKGAVVVSNPKTGEILALYSAPSYSPNKFTLGMTGDEYKALTTNPDLPMFNRAIGGAYPPGSTFKIVTSIAGLQEGTITDKTTYEDVGEIVMGQFKFPNWYYLEYGGKDGIVDVTKALKRSNDIFYYKAGEELGITKLAAWGKKLGIGSLLGIELPGAASGLMADPAWKAQRFSTPQDILNRNNDWYLGDTYHLAIGQGYLLATPLHVNTWTNVIANTGYLCKPTLIKRQDDVTLVTAGKPKATGCTDLNLVKQTVDLITTGMREACDPGGTGWPMFGFGIKKPVPGASPSASATPSAEFVRIPVACKTGTAEWGNTTDNTHAWFTAFAPIPEQYAGLDPSVAKSITGEPEISVTVLEENAGQGSDQAAPLARKILEEWFSR